MLERTFDKSAADSSACCSRDVVDTVDLRPETTEGVIDPGKPVNEVSPFSERAESAPRFLDFVELPVCAVPLLSCEDTSVRKEAARPRKL